MEITPENLETNFIPEEIANNNVSVIGGSILAGTQLIATIDSLGNTVYKAIKIGGSSVQYTMNDYGLFSFGDGSDGALSTTGNVTLTADKYYTDLTINNGHTFNPAGYRVFCTGTFTLKAGGIFARNGNNGGAGGDGGNAVGGTGGTAGTLGIAGEALADGYLKGSVVGAIGGAGGVGGNAPGGAGANGSAGVAGGNTSNSIGSDGIVGLAGGNAYGGPTGGAAGAKGTATASLCKLIANWHLATLLDVSSTGATVKFNNSASGGGSGGGAGGYASIAGYGGGGGGGGGGSGSNGGIISIYAKNIVIESTGLLKSLGGGGGNGGNGGSAVTYGEAGAGGSGGVGGNGGQIILIYNILTNAGTISVAGGTGGTKGIAGTGSHSADDGSTGTGGAAGTIRYFNISL